MARKRLSHTTSLFLLLSSSCAWANDGSIRGRQLQSVEPLSRRAPEEVALESESLSPLRRLIGAEGVEVVEKQVDYVVVRIRDEIPSSARNHQLQQDEEDAFPPTQPPQVTPPPNVELVRRQDDGQVSALSSQLQSISDASRQVSQASQQLSQSSQQLSQSLQQAQQSLSETERQLSSARSDADSNRRSAEDASRSADQAMSRASQSISQNMASITRSAGESAASMISAASQSAESIMNDAASMVQQARADATSVRAEADTRILQAQGAAVSVTQAALAIVGAMVGSSLLTIVAFVLISRFRRRRKERRAARTGTGGPGRFGDISYPAPSNGGSGDPKSYDAGAYETGVGFNSYPADIKEPLPAAAVGVARGARSSISTDITSGASNNGSVGYAATRNYAKPAGFQLQDPPRGKLSLFPRSREEAEQRGAAGSRSPRSQDGDDDDASHYGDEPEAAGSQQQPQQQQQRTSRLIPPSLETWLKASTVSPFGTLNRSTPSPEAAKGAKRGPNWPLGRSGT